MALVPRLGLLRRSQQYAAAQERTSQHESMQALRAELEKTELDKLRWRDLANDTKNRLKQERAGISIVVVVAAAAAVVFS